MMFAGRVLSVILSDVLGDSVDMIASGPTCADPSTCQEAEDIVQKYGLKLSLKAQECLRRETVKNLPEGTLIVSGSVKELCKAAMEACKERGYTPFLLTDSLCCEAREAGSFLASVLKTHQDAGKDLAFVAGGYVDGETAKLLREKGFKISRILEENDAYHALEQTGGLIFTGPTGTNVNDVAVGLIRGKDVK